MARKKIENKGSGRKDDEVLVIPSAADWAALMAEPCVKDDPGQTVNEIMEQTGRGRTMVKQWLSKEIASGRIAVGSRGIKSVSGCRQRVPVYTPVEDKQ
jgi:hypothetical protein